MAEHETKKEPIEIMLEYLAEFEKRRLSGTKPEELKRGQQEFSQLSAYVREMGIRVSKREIAAARNKCSSCGRPLDPRGPYQTVSIFSVQLGAHVNEYACRETCYQKLQEKSRKVQQQLIAEQNG